MDVDLKGFFLRPIQSTDDPKKLSLGDVALTPLKTFLVHDAWEFHQNQIAKTYVLVQSGSTRIWGYITLVSSEASLEEEQRPENPVRALRYATFPAVKIARLAVDQKIQGQGFGKVLLKWALNHIRMIIMPNIGCRFIVVDSKPSSISFYERCGFTLVANQSSILEENPMMFFDLAKIEVTPSSKKIHQENFMVLDSV